MVSHEYSLSVREAGLEDHEFKASMCYIVRLCLKKV